MKLSEAIREGIKKDGVQVFNTYFDYAFPDPGASFYSKANKEAPIIGCCALGAALIGIRNFKTYKDVNINESMGIYKEFPALNRCNFKFPLRDSFDQDLFSAITSLNDTYKWTREQIADWLEGIGE
jgi:hypothetical protein